MSISDSDKAQLQRILIGIVTQQVVKSLTWQDVMTDIATFTADDQAAFTAAIASGIGVSDFVGNRLNNYATTKATQTVTPYIDSGQFPIDFIASIVLT